MPWQRKSEKNMVSLNEFCLLNFIDQSLLFCTGLHIELQEKMLNQETEAQKPDVEFLCSLSGVVGSRWPSLAVSLPLSKEEIEELKGKVGLSQQQIALQMLRVWSSRKEATYGQLYHKLKTIALFQHSI